jgi:hypothetical protein
MILLTPEAKWRRGGSETTKKESGSNGTEEVTSQQNLEENGVVFLRNVGADCAMKLRNVPEEWCAKVCSVREDGDFVKQPMHTFTKFL